MLDGCQRSYKRKRRRVLRLRPYPGRDSFRRKVLPPDIAEPAERDIGNPIHGPRDSFDSPAPRESGKERICKAPARDFGREQNSARQSKLEPFKKFVGMLRPHLSGVLAWTETRFANGAVEGMNNNSKSISHRSFGFRRNFIAAIDQCCARLPLPAER
jgi:hypothetical protein